MQHLIDLIDQIDDLPVEIIVSESPEGNLGLLDQWSKLNSVVQTTLVNVRTMVTDYLTAHENQTGTASADFVAWRARVPKITAEELADEHFEMLAELADWLWTTASPAQLLHVRPMLSEMLSDSNRALSNHFRGTMINADKPAEIDLSAAREALCGQVDGVRGLAKSGVFPGLSEDWVLRIKGVEIGERKGSESGVYKFPRAPKTVSAEAEKKKNGGQSFRTQNTRVRLYRNGELPTDFPATLGEACKLYFKCSVQDAAKFFDGWAHGATYTTSDGTVWSWVLTEA